MSSTERLSANMMFTSESKANTREKMSESFLPITLKQRIKKLLRDVFEGHEEYLGVTPD